MTVKEAIRRLKVKNNDEESVKTLIGEYDPYLEKVIPGFLRNIAGMDAGDIKQELYLRLLRKIPSIDIRKANEEIDSYLKTMFRNALIVMTRKSKKEREKLTSLENNINKDSDEDEMKLEEMLADVKDNVFKTVEQTQFLEELMNSLSPRTQKIVEAILSSEGSIKKIKEELDKNPEYKSSKGVIRRMIEEELKPALNKVLDL